MSLPKARDGDSYGFHICRTVTDEWTLGDPEAVIWSSIRHMSVAEVADYVLSSSHKISSGRDRQNIVRNLKIYLRHAYEFYDAAKSAKANTAPLFYYYSFLHLAKGICEISRPRFHQTSECYAHGVTWSPNHDYVVRMHRESIRVSTRRGVWHALWEAVQMQPCIVTSPLPLSIQQLFFLNNETSRELQSIYGEAPYLIPLVQPDVLLDSAGSQIWLRFSVRRADAKRFGLSRAALLSMIASTSTYHQVESVDKELWTFEFQTPKAAPYEPDRVPFDLVESEIKAMYLVSSQTGSGLQYALPVQRRLPIRLPQIVVLYSLVFWLGSLVRYDPHSVADLQDSEYWTLIDGFMNQSRIWLLELFEWEFYKTETTLRSVR